MNIKVASGRPFLLSAGLRNIKAISGHRRKVRPVIEIDRMEALMAKVAALVHLMLMTVLMGVLVIVIVSVPSLYDQGMKLIPIAAAVGFVIAIPFSIWISRRILEQTRGA